MQIVDFFLFHDWVIFHQGVLGGQMVKNLLVMQETQVQSGIRKIPWRKKWLPTPVSLPEEFHEQRSLVGYSPWGQKIWTWLRREAKSQWEKERYTHLNAEFQRITRRDKKAFLSNQCKEVKENNRMGRLEISSRRLEIPREHFMQRWVQKRTEMVGT